MKASDIIALVHERDGLVEERARLVGDLDLKIAAIDEQLEGLGPKTNGNGHVQTPRLEQMTLTSDPTTNTGRVISMIRAHRTLDYGQVAEMLYGEDTTAMRKRLRSLLSALATNERIRNVGRNEWEVVER